VQIRDKAETTESLMEDREPYFICIGRLEQQKNFSQALRAFALFSKTHNAFRLLIVGEGSQERSLKALAEELGIKDKAHFKGYGENPLPLLKNSVGLLLPSLYEGCPNVAMEAVILNVPILISDIPAHQAIFADDVAHYFPLDDPEATGRVMAQSLQSDKHADATLIHSWSAVENGKKYLEIIEKTLPK
jgi:glycosyltransferase involved in cell wall biosynthesis